MRSFFCFLIMGALPVLGQEEPPLPGAAAPVTTASPTPAPSVPPRLTPPPQLISPDVLPPPKPSELRPEVPDLAELDAAFAPAPLGPIAEQQRMHQEWRRLRNRVRNDADLRAALRHAETAPTDLEKRQRLADYYVLLYARLVRIAPAGMRDYLENKKREALSTLPQPRVRPEAFPELRAATPTPAPTTSPAPAERMVPSADARLGR